MLHGHKDRKISIHQFPIGTARCRQSIFKKNDVDKGNISRSVFERGI